MNTPTISGIATLTCEGDCRATIAVKFDNVPPDEVEDHILEVAESLHHWHRGMYCPSCSDQARRDEELSDAAKEDRMDREWMKYDPAATNSA